MEAGERSSPGEMGQRSAKGNNRPESLRAAQGSAGNTGHGQGYPGKNPSNELIDTWELLYKVNGKGEQNLPEGSIRTLLEFTDGGRVIVNQVDRQDADSLTSKQGTYTTENREIHITDHEQRTCKWPYELVGDQLITVMETPEEKLKFHWRRYR